MATIDMAGFLSSRVLVSSVKNFHSADSGTYLLQIYIARYVDTVYSRLFPRVVHGEVGVWRIVARSPTNRPRLGFYGPPEEDLCIDGDIQITIRPWGCDDVAEITFNRFVSLLELKT